MLLFRYLLYAFFYRRATQFHEDTSRMDYSMQRTAFQMQLCAAFQRADICAKCVSQGYNLTISPASYRIVGIQYG